ncbi:MAG: peroxide stress protein YaaA [Planctomycetota bacterium]
MLLIILSPAKALDFETPLRTNEYSLPEFSEASQELVQKLKKISISELAKIMKLSPKLAEINQKRFKEWKLPFTLGNARQAILAYNGDVYDGMNVSDYEKEDFKFAQKHLRILSGLHGLLKPMDLIQPYRLEMGTPLKNSKGDDLYKFWGERVTTALNETFKKKKDVTLINLASEEYCQVILRDALKVPLISPIFKEDRNGGNYATVAFYAKKARGMMARYIIKNRITELEDIKGFKEEGYRFNAKISSESEWLFTRKVAKSI